MYLYVKSGNKLEVYEFNVNKKKLIDFRRNCLDEVPEDRRVLRAVASDCFTHRLKTNTVLKENEIFSNSEEFYSNNWHTIKKHVLTEEEKNRQNNLLDCYCNNFGSNHLFYIPCQDENNRKKLVINKDYNALYLVYLHSGIYTTLPNGTSVCNNLINIPENLYFYEMFRQSEGRFIQNIDLGSKECRKILPKLLNLYNSPVCIDNFNLDDEKEFASLHCYYLKSGIKYPDPEGLESELEKSQKVLSLIK